MPRGVTLQLLEVTASKYLWNLNLLILHFSFYMKQKSEV